MKEKAYEVPASTTRHGDTLYYSSLINSCLPPVARQHNNTTAIYRSVALSLRSLNGTLLNTLLPLAELVSLMLECSCLVHFRVIVIAHVTGTSEHNRLRLTESAGYGDILTGSGGPCISRLGL